MLNTIQNSIKMVFPKLTTLLHQKRYDEALKICDGLILQDPEDKNVIFSAMCHKGIVCSRQGRDEDAVKIWKEALGLGIPESEIKDRYLMITAHYGLGSIYKNKGSLEEARKQFEIVLKLVAQLVLFEFETIGLASGAHFHLGEIYQRQGRLREARQELEECLRLNPKHNKAKLLSSQLTNE